MQSAAATVEDYLAELPEDRKEPMQRLRRAIQKNLPKGFAETISYGMIGYVVPHSLYPDGYHCDPKLPLPFLAIASQKNFIALYHMGIYADPKLNDWFTKAYANQVKTKLDMGKSCIRFKTANELPLDLIGALVSKMTAQEWIRVYEKNYKK